MTDNQQRPRVAYNDGNVVAVDSASASVEQGGSGVGHILVPGVGIGPALDLLPPGMHFVLTELANPLTRFVFPMNPEKVTVSDESKAVTFASAALGDIQIPRGRAAMRFAWDGILPGAPRFNYSFVKFWRQPIDAVWNLRVWQGFNTRLHLLITETDIHDDVFISRLERTFAGGYGDITYTIELTELRPVFVQLYTPTPEEAAAIAAIGQGKLVDVAGTVTDTPGAALPSDDPNAKPAPAPETQPTSRSEDPPPTSYTVKAGDNLTTIAKVQLGDSSRWKEIYELNKDALGNDPDKVEVGTVLKLPSSDKPTAGEQTTDYVKPGSNQSAPVVEGTRATGGREQ